MERTIPTWNVVRACDGRYFISHYECLSSKFWEWAESREKACEIARKLNRGQEPIVKE